MLQSIGIHVGTGQGGGGGGGDLFNCYVQRNVLSVELVSVVTFLAVPVVARAGHE